MKYGFYAVFDSQVKVFMRPLMARSFGEAERAFGDAVRHPESDYGRHPDDYALFHVGSFDEETGQMSGVTAPQRVIGARDCLPKGPALEAEG